MTKNSDKGYHRQYTKLENRLFASEGVRWRFWFFTLLVIFIVELSAFVVLSLLFPLPGYLAALLDAFLLIIIIFLIFRPHIIKERSFHNERIAEAQETLRKSEERYRALVESTEDSIYLVNRQYFYIFVNKNHMSRLKYSSEEYVGRPYSEFHTEEETSQFESAVDEVFAMGKSIQQEHKSERDNRYFLRTLSPVRDKNGSVSAVMIISKQITELKKMEDELRKLSLTDEMTGLYNRRGFITIASQQIKVANRLKRELMLVSADLDDLKTINDTYGHKEGDQALIDATSILQETFRSSDIIARIGGDEFVALQIKNPDEPYLSASTDRLQESLKKHNSQSGKPYDLSLSMGTVVYNPEDSRTLEQLLAEADSKMYEQKRSKSLNNK
jgi:diguanylate cyclase (GGDEF)-like protein/PAS domain S-box-containing protein